jgi:hypothetical protein
MARVDRARSEAIRANARDAADAAASEVEPRRAAAANATAAVAPDSAIVPHTPLSPVAAQPASNESPKPEPSTTSLPVAPPPVAVVNPIVRERPAILSALEQYRRAHQNRSSDALRAVYPGLAGEKLQAKQRAFKDNQVCRALDVQFGEPEILLAADGAVAHVSVMSTYMCTPSTGQARPHEPFPDVFQMRKDGDGWIITALGAMAR